MTEIEKMRREQLQKECRSITGNFEEIGFLIGIEDIFYACARNKEDYEEISSLCTDVHYCMDRIKEKANIKYN